MKIEELLAVPKTGIIPDKQKQKCIGKTKYASKHSAREASHEYLRDTGERMRPYECEWCGFHHIGHIKGRLKGY